ncbi:3-oxoacyl-ACP reductase FabG [Raineyella sp. LH-20]|uniref:3-oxoacyl-ACP reductase FabG n=1 Tax=Raineyella sp. LH-20 TaxID=3081204 RepID=UPI0029547ECC|nr:3-oxoacyl-ACP reductase FabG [Raineyella sp. LH-20]WOP17518.1 3-oxoacyl-ACP reductase FabG [Raineyella sp. LH-20]
MLFDLADRRVLVTGGSKGIGLGIATTFAKAGAAVAVTARGEADLAAAAERLAAAGASEVVTVAADVADRASTRAMIREVVERLGGLDVLCANAGVFPEASLATMTEEQLDDVVAVNLKGTVWSVQAAAPALAISGRGRVIITSSITGAITGYPGWAHYGATKAAQLGFMRTAALELAPHGITVNAVLPGNVLTEGLVGMGEGYLAAMTRAVPLGRLGTPEEVGATAAFLATTEAGYLTAQAIVVDGGQILPETPEAILA